MLIAVKIMGDIADQIINGEICEMCQQATEDCPVGWAFTCSECRDESPELILNEINKQKVDCPICGKRYKKTGIYNHTQSAHPESMDDIHNALLLVLEYSKNGK